jgi:hypothetical protein
MTSLIRYLLAALFACISVVAVAQDEEEEEGPAPPPKTTSATDHKIRVQRTRRASVDHSDTQGTSPTLKKRRISGGAASSRQARVYKKHRHFADKDIKLRSKSKVARRGTLGISTDE